MLVVQAVTEAPLFVGAAPEAGNIVRGLRHIPGSVLRGALAAEWIRRNGPPRPGDQDFTATFDGQVRFGPLLPEDAVLEPASVLRCKHLRSPGCSAAVVDLLADPVGKNGRPRRCTECGGPLEAGKGRLLHAQQETHTRVELTAGETAREGQLFSREAIPAGTKLTGSIVDPTSWLETLDGVGLWFGGRRTVAGRLTLNLEEAPDATPPDRGPELALVLVTPGVVVDAATRPVLDFPAAEIARGLGIDPAHVRVDERWVRAERVSGWHAASGLPKPEDLAVAAGSAALISLGATVTTEQLARLARRGLGLRRCEGFGIVEVNPPRWQPPPPPTSTGLALKRRAEVDAALVAIREHENGQRLLGWLCEALREQAERAETNSDWPVDHVLGQRADLRHAGKDLREALGALFTVEFGQVDGTGPAGGSVPAELRARADQLEGAR